MCLGIPGQIVKIDDVERKLATADVSGVKRRINLACIIDADHPVESCVGDWVVIHVGFAMNRMAEAEARATMQILVELGEAQAEIAAMAGTSSRPRTRPLPRLCGGIRRRESVHRLRLRQPRRRGDPRRRADYQDMEVEEAA